MIMFSQVGCVINEVADFAQDLPVVLAGDFNATPVMSVYSLITEGHLTDNAIKQLLTSDCQLTAKLFQAIESLSPHVSYT